MEWSLFLGVQVAVPVTSNALSNSACSSAIVFVSSKFAFLIQICGTKSIRMEKHDSELHN